MIGATDGTLDDCAAYLSSMFRGMGDEVAIKKQSDHIEIEHSGLRVIKGLPEQEANLVFDCWAELWKGMGRSQRQMKTISVERNGLEARWHLGAAGP